MRSRSRGRTNFAQFAVLFAGLCLASIPVQGGANGSRSLAMQRARPELIDLDSRGTVSFMRGRLGQIDLQDAGRNGARLMEDLAPLLHAPADGRFRPLSTKSDALGLTHVRVQQFINDLPVVGADSYVHADRTGNVYAINGTIAADWSASAPELAGDLAIRQALRELLIEPSRVGGPALTYVLDEEGRARLAWGFEVEYTNAVGPQRDRVFADATDGSVAARHPQNHYSRNRSTYTCNNGTSLPGTLRRAEGQGPVADAIVNNAHDNAGYTYDYYNVKFGRDSYNNAGAALRSSVHYGNNYGNAYWNSTQLVYGDGDGVETGNMAVLDVTGHELTHAVTENESGLIYSGESGGLNESISDIFGANIEAWVDGAINSDTWKVGEDCMTPGIVGDALRYMNDPALDGGSKDFWSTAVGNSDVHYISGIPNLAYVLLVQGGMHPRGKSLISVHGIGMSKAEQIFYRAQTTYLTSSSKLRDAHSATMQAAADLYSEIEVHAVDLAWEAVNVRATTVSVGPGDAPAPVAHMLDVSPNPFSQSTRIHLGLAPAGDAVLDVYDSSGRVVRKLIASGSSAGERSATWDARDDRGVRVSSGVYFIRLADAPEANAVRVTLLK